MYEYFESSWIIKLDFDFDKFCELSIRQSYELSLAKRYQITDDGLITYLLIIKVDSSDTLIRFTNDIGSHFGLNQWIPSTQEKFSDGLLLSHFWNNSPWTEKGAILDQIFAFARRNESIVDMQSESKDSSFFAVDFIVTQSQLDKYIEYFKHLVNSGRIVYSHRLKENEKGCFIQTIAVRVRTQSELDVQYNWYSMTRDEFYCGTKLVNSQLIEESWEVLMEFAKHNGDKGCT